MLLFLDQKNDLHADWVEAECRLRDQDFLRLCTEDFPQRIRLSLRYRGAELGGSLRLPDRQVCLDEIRGVWHRRPGAPLLPADLPREYRAFVLRECRAFLLGLYRALHDRRWLNPPHRDGGAHKLAQLRLAAQLGLTIPPTLVTNDPREVPPFFEACRGRMIYKPLGYSIVGHPQLGEAAIYTNVVERRHLEERLAAVAQAPCLFQERVPKSHELRVTVFGDRAWAAAIYSQESERTTVDCRHDLSSLRTEAVLLDPTLGSRCVRLTHRLGLRMGMLDLIVTPEGEHVFLEINPNGQWAWIEARTGLPLATALVDELLGVDTLSHHPYVRHRSLDFEPQTAIVGAA